MHDGVGEFFFFLTPEHLLCRFPPWSRVPLIDPIAPSPAWSESVYLSHGSICGHACSSAPFTDVRQSCAVPASTLCQKMQETKIFLSLDAVFPLLCNYKSSMVAGVELSSVISVSVYGSRINIMNIGPICLPCSIFIRFFLPFKQQQDVLRRCLKITVVTLHESFLRQQ